MVGTRGLEGSFLLMNGDRRIPVKSTQKKCGQTFTALLLYVDFIAIMNIIQVLEAGMRIPHFLLILVYILFKMKIILQIHCHR